MPDETLLVEEPRAVLAEVLKAHRWGFCDEDGTGCTCLSFDVHYDNWPEHVAAAVLAALNLTEEWTPLNPYAARNGAPAEFSVRLVSPPWQVTK